MRSPYLKTTKKAASTTSQSTCDQNTNNPRGRSHRKTPNRGSKRRVKTLTQVAKLMQIRVGNPRRSRRRTRRKRSKRCVM